MDTVALEPNGSFSYTLPYAFPVTAIYTEIGNKFRGGFWLDGDLHLEIRATLKQNDEGETVKTYTSTYSGPSGTLNEARDAFFDKIDKQIYGYFTQTCLNIAVDKDLSLERRKVKIDSLYAEKLRDEEKYLPDAPEPFRQYWISERESDFLGIQNSLYWNESDEMPAQIRQRIEEHQPLLASTTVSSFYNDHFGLVSENARQVSQADSILSHAAKQLRFANLACTLVDSLYAPARADLYKIRFYDNEPTILLGMLDIALPTVTTPWVRSSMMERMDGLRSVLTSLESALSKLTDDASGLPDIGASKGQYPFGANLYQVDEELDAQQLLAKLRGTFPGQHLYLDFWAVWCEPCLKQMPASAKLHEETKGLPVEFVYLCTSSGGDVSKWQGLIGQHEVPGTHLFIDEKVHEELMQMLGLSGYPSYLLLSPDGGRNMNVPRPSGLNREKVEALLEK